MASGATRITAVRPVGVHPMAAATTRTSAAASPAKSNGTRCASHDAPLPRSSTEASAAGAATCSRSRVGGTTACLVRMGSTAMGATVHESGTAGATGARAFSAVARRDECPAPIGIAGLLVASGGDNPGCCSRSAAG